MVSTTRTPKPLFTTGYLHNVAGEAVHLVEGLDNHLGAILERVQDSGLFLYIQVVRRLPLLWRFGLGTEKQYI